MGEQVTDTRETIRITWAERDGASVVTVAGEVDLRSFDVLDTRLTALLDRLPTALVVDLDRVEFFGSLGVSTMLRAFDHAQRRGVGFAVVATRREVLRTLEITDTVALLRVCGTLPEALDLARSAV